MSMASPQIENGYTKIANELYEKILEYPFTLYEIKTILAIVRDTYGWNAAKKQISNKRIADLSNIELRNTQKRLKTLQSRNIIFKQKTKKNKNIWGINKDYEEWLLPNGNKFIEEPQTREGHIKPEWQEIWEQNHFPEITEFVKQTIDKLIETYSESEFVEALKISIKQNSKKLAYIQGILKKRSSGETHNDTTGKTKVENGEWMTDEELAAAEIKGEIYYDRDKNTWYSKGGSR